MNRNPTEQGYTSHVAPINFDVFQKKSISPFLSKLQILIKQESKVDREKSIKQHLENYTIVHNELKHKQSDEEIQEFFTEFLKLINTISNKELIASANIIIDELWFSNILTRDMLINLPDKSCLIIYCQEDSQIKALTQSLQDTIKIATLSYKIQNQNLTQALITEAISNFNYLSQEAQTTVIDFLFQENKKSLEQEKQLIQFCSTINLPRQIEYYMIGHLNSIIKQDFIKIIPTIILSRITYSFKHESPDKKIMRLYMNLLLEICQSDESILKDAKEQLAQLDSTIKLQFFRLIHLFNIPVEDSLLMTLINKEVVLYPLLQDQAFSIIKRVLSQNDESLNEVINTFIQQVLKNEIYIPIAMRNELSQLSAKFADNIAKIIPTKSYYMQVLERIPEFNEIMRKLSYQDLQTAVNHLDKHPKNNQSYLPVCFSRKILEGDSSLEDTQNSRIIAELDAISSNSPIAYFFACQENSNMGLAHIELIIKIGNIYILPYNLPYDQAASILSNGDKIFYHANLSMLIEGHLQAKAPQADTESCGALAYMYAKKILQKQSVALLEFSLCLDIEDGDTHKRFFLPPPHVLKNSQSSTYIEAIKHSMDEIERLLLNKKVIYYLKLDRSNLQQPEKLQLSYENFISYKAKWLKQLEIVEEKRQKMLFKSPDYNKLQNVNLAYNRWKIVEHVWA